MTDIELMLLAAKAAGIRLEWIADTAFDCTNLKPGKPASKGKMWWPLVDDGDALRLAVKLRISLVHEQEYMGGPVLETIEAISQPKSGDGSRICMTECLNEHNANEMAATRRAIVRAAAEIGRAVQKPLAP